MRDDVLETCTVTLAQLYLFGDESTEPQQVSGGLVPSRNGVAVAIHPAVGPNIII